MHSFDLIDPITGNAQKVTVKRQRNTFQQFKKWLKRKFRIGRKVIDSLLQAKDVILADPYKDRTFDQDFVEGLGTPVDWGRVSGPSKAIPKEMAIKD